MCGNGGNIIAERASEEVNLNDYLPQLAKLRQDSTIPMYQTNVVFLVPNLTGNWIGRQFLYSILDKRLKKAKVYWFVNVNVTDEPYTQEYEVDMMETDFIVKLKLHLGFRMNQRCKCLYSPSD